MAIVLALCTVVSTALGGVFALRNRDRLHLVLGFTSSLLICWLGWIHFRQRRASISALPGYYLPLELLRVSIVALTAHLGGFLSGVNVPG